MVNRSPVIQLGSDQSFCYGDSAAFEAGAGFISYHWSTAESGSNISVKSAGQYWVKATTDKGCNSYDTVSIQNVWDLPQPRLDKQAGLCTGEARTLNPGRFASYRWQDGSVAPTYRASAPGQYFVRVTDLHGCAASDTAVVTTMLPLPGKFLPRDTALCSYSSLILKPLQTFNAYLWSTGDIAANITVVQAGTYWLEVEDQSGCRGKDSIIIKPKECTTGVYVSTAFTPNGDGKNDVFKALVFGQVNKFEFRIYNRWGQVVFYTTDPIKGWDGKVKGLDQDTGVFVWTCRYMLVGEQEKFEKGTVTIIR
jgi:gliding motility-associated-like protein